jgi:hypothetical protein
MRRVDSPITQTLQTWPLAGEYHMRWGRDEEGEMWVVVESPEGQCKAALPYQTYLDLEESRSGWWEAMRG